MTDHSSVKETYSRSAQKLNISTEHFGKCPNVILVDDIVTLSFYSSIIFQNRDWTMKSVDYRI